MEKHIIFGLENHSLIQLKRLIALNDLNPVCYATRNEKIIGLRTHSLDLPIVHIFDALNNYPDAKIFLADPHPIKFMPQTFLMKLKISKNRILNYDDFEKVNSCYWPKTFFTIYSKNIMPCSEMRIFDHSLEFTSDSKTSLRNYFNWASELNTEMQESQSSICEGCPNLRIQYVPKKTIIQQVGYGIGNVCNSNCVYCARNISEAGERLSTNVKSWQDSFNFVEFLDVLTSSEFYDKKVTQLFLGPAEITVHPNKNAILDSVLDVPVILASNSFIYNEKVSKVIQKPYSYLFTSLDAGTSETFKRVKGHDRFESTVNNLIKYSDDGGNIYLKYIVIPENVSDEDLEGFIEVVDKLNLLGVDISVDAFLDENLITEEMREFALKLSVCLDERRIPYIKYF